MGLLKSFVVAVVLGSLLYWATGLALGASFGGVLGVALYQSYVMLGRFQGTAKSLRDWGGLFATLGVYLGVLIFVGSSFFERYHEEQEIVLSPPPFTTLSELSASGPLAAQLRSWMDAQIRSDAYPSLAIAVADEQGVLFSHVAGEGANPANEKPLLFPIASVTKAFTGVLLLRLHQEGIIDVDATLDSLLPAGVAIGHPNQASTITPMMLAQHVSGLPRSVKTKFHLQEGNYQTFQANLLYGALGKTKVRFKPGSDRSYSNLGYGLLGHLLELASGQSYEQLLQTRIFTPAKLQDSQLLDYTNSQFLDRLVTPRKKGLESDKLPYAKLSKRLAASGGIATTAADLARFGSALLQSNSPILDTKHQAMLLQDHYQSAEQLTIAKRGDSAFGGIRKWKGVGWVTRKNGGRAGAAAFMALSAKHKRVVAVIANRGARPYTGSPDDIGYQLMQWLTK